MTGPEVLLKWKVSNLQGEPLAHEAQSVLGGKWRVTNRAGSAFLFRITDSANLYYGAFDTVEEAKLEAIKRERGPA